jgi:hypothetical protein
MFRQKTINGYLISIIIPLSSTVMFVTPETFKNIFGKDEPLPSIDKPPENYPLAI